ncbi:hypothetical protein [Paraburkholderia fungorum]|uniref:hypothetical protein n=1 Tax=Paraburkholderia fungorum TaxID=134537 RepID=UPI0038BA0858
MLPAGGGQFLPFAGVRAETFKCLFRSSQRTFTSPITLVLSSLKTLSALTHSSQQNQSLHIQTVNSFHSRVNGGLQIELRDVTPQAPAQLSGMPMTSDIV